MRSATSLAMRHIEESSRSFSYSAPASRINPLDIKLSSTASMAQNSARSASAASETICLNDATNSSADSDDEQFLGPDMCPLRFFCTFP